MTFRDRMRHMFENPIRAFALACVAATSAFLMYLILWLVEIQASPDWCGRALQAEKITPGNTFVGLTACIEILKLQVGSLSQALTISVGTLALCLGVLVVIVIAGARLAGKIFGQEIDVSRQDAKEAAAEHVVQGAQQAAAEVEGGAT